MAIINGTYECKLDAKSRLMFPGAFKKQLGKLVDDGFIIKRSIFKSCLEIYPMEEWNKETAMINKINKFRKKNVDFITKFMAWVRDVKLDSAGRFLIPKDLLKFGNIEKEIVLASVVNKIEVWDKKAYENAIDYDPDDFANLAEEVMGDIDIEEE
ncbi:division/cell wall cluster transcriptional repressor MraZ [Bacteroidota bacterium]